MDRHFYLVSQLPSLRFGERADWSSEEFFEQAEKWLSPRELAALSRADISGALFAAEADPPALATYLEFEQQLRGEVARWRLARRAGQEYRSWLFPPGLVSEGTPLDIEMKLLRLRWDEVEAMEVGHHFDLDILVLYGLKLRILERVATFDKDAGARIFARLGEVES